MSTQTLVMFGLLTLGAYVLGATPFAWLIARAYGKDLRREGSGNIGATNLGRVLGKRWGIVCFLLDTGKGLAATLTGWALLHGLPDFPTPAHQAVWLALGFGAILGHVFSFYLGFRGGKGVATSLGVVLGIWPFFTYAGLAALGLWIVVTLASRYVSVGSVVAAIAFVPLVLMFNAMFGRSIDGLWPLLTFAIVMMALVVVKHRGNIRRLLAGTEHRIGQR